MSNTLGGGYPTSIGSKVAALIRHAGPASYTAVTSGATPSGGDKVTAPMFGLKFIDALFVMGDETGVYQIIPIAKPGPATSIILRWYTTAGGPPATFVEVTAGVTLSAKYVTLLAIGQP